MSMSLSLAVITMLLSHTQIDNSPKGIAKMQLPTRVYVNYIPHKVRIHNPQTYFLRAKPLQEAHIEAIRGRDTGKHLQKLNDFKKSGIQVYWDIISIPTFYLVGMPLVPQS